MTVPSITRVLNKGKKHSLPKNLCENCMTTQHALGDSPESELSLSHTSHKLHLFSTLDRLLILRTAQALWTVQPFASESAQANSCRLIRLLGHYPNSTSNQFVYVSVLGVLIVFVAWHPWSLCACFITYDSIIDERARHEQYSKHYTTLSSPSGQACQIQYLEARKLGYELQILTRRPAVRTNEIEILIGHCSAVIPGSLESIFPERASLDYIGFHWVGRNQ